MRGMNGVGWQDSKDWNRDAKLCHQRRPFTSSLPGRKIMEKGEESGDEFR